MFTYISERKRKIPQPEMKIVKKKEKKTDKKK